MTENGLIRPYQSSYSLLYRLADAMLITGSLWLSTLIMDVHWTPNYSIAVLLAVVMFFMFAGHAGLYHSWRDSSPGSEAQRILHVWIWVILGLLLLAYTTKQTAIFSRRAVTLWLIAAPTLAVLWRLVVYSVLHHLRNAGVKQRRVLVAGAGELGQRLLDTIVANSWMNLVVAGVYDDEAEPGQRPVEAIDAEVQGGLDDLVAAARSGQCDEIYLALPVQKQDRIREILDALADSSLPVHIVPDLFTYTLLHASWRQVGSLPVVSVYGTPHEGMGGVVKRAEDLVLGTLILLIVAIPMLLIALGMFSFLGVASLAVPEQLKGKSLPAARPRSSLAAKMAKQAALLLRSLGFPRVVTKIKTAPFIQKALYKKYDDVSKPAPKERTVQRLKARFAPEVRQLDEWFGLDLVRQWGYGEY